MSKDNETIEMPFEEFMNNLLEAAKQNREHNFNRDSVVTTFLEAAANTNLLNPNKVLQESIIKAFLTKMAAQDNRSTRAPYFYQIYDKEKAFHEDGELRCFYDEDGEGCTETDEDLVEEITQKLIDDEEFEPQEDLEARDEVCRDRAQEIVDNEEWEDYGYKAFHYGWEFRPIPNTLFLTETDAKEHLKNNYYHYSSEAYTYVAHAWRAPELENFMSALFQYFNVGCGQYTLPTKLYPPCDDKENK